MAVDTEREEKEPAFRQKNEAYRGAIRRNGFHLVLKEVKRYRNADGEVATKANSDLDLAVDALLQSNNLDYILLGTGDGDFIRLVRAIQNHGRRIDVLSFANTSGELKEEADRYVSGFLIPGLVRGDEERPRQRGLMHHVDEERGFGFLTLRTGLGADDTRENVFCHITDFTRSGSVVSNDSFRQLKTSGTILEFDLEAQDDGRQRARRVTELQFGGNAVRV